MKMNKKQLLKYNTVIIKDKFISTDHQATYKKSSIGGYICTIKKSNNKHLTSITDLLDYINQLTTEGTCTATASTDTKTLIVK